jgi:hypothetical protein
LVRTWRTTTSVTDDAEEAIFAGVDVEDLEERLTFGRLAEGQMDLLVMLNTTVVSCDMFSRPVVQIGFDSSDPRVVVPPATVAF